VRLINSKGVEYSYCVVAEDPDGLRCHVLDDGTDHRPVVPYTEVCLGA
jgi:hypothetical protein